jgi:hypothetical protein
MRSKMEYLRTEDDRGKMKIEKAGLAPVQREGMEYEFDIVAEFDVSHNLVITKTRCSRLDGYVASKPDMKPIKILQEWLEGGDAVVASDDVAALKAWLVENNISLAAAGEASKEKFGVMPSNLTVRQLAELKSALTPAAA